MKSDQVHIGIDVSKDVLDISPCHGVPLQCSNSQRGIRSLIKKIQKQTFRPVVCCEASGGYERLLVRQLADAGIHVARVNAKQVRDFARSQGILAKTESIDAHVLARFSEVNKPRPFVPSTAWRDALGVLLSRRAELIDLRTQEKNRLSLAPAPIAANSIRSLIKHLDKLMAKVEEQIEQLLEDHRELRETCDRLLKIKGVGQLSALNLIAFLPELGALSDNEAAALVGVAPFNHDSGKMRGRRSIRGGRSNVRTAMYMAATSASQHNVILRRFYQRMREKGKPHKVAITAVIRKLVCLANRLMADPSFQLLMA